MDGLALLGGFAAGACAGAAVAWALAQSRTRRAAAEAAAEKARLEERVRALEDMERSLSDRFQALSAEALRHQSQAFLDLAGTKFEGLRASAQKDLEARQAAIDELLKPIRESLKGVDATIRGVEEKRAGAYAALHEQVKGLTEGQGALRSETANLVRALRAPQVRGRWGEIQLRNVVEMAGMLDHCDFTEQVSADAEGGRLRPDLVVHLPGGRQVIVDAKTPLESYLAAAEEKDDARRDQHLADHARRVREHVRALSQKSYWDQFEGSPEFVVMFLPGETFFSAALQKDPSLIEFGVGQKVIPASPTTLIALLRAVAYGWQQERVAEDAKRIQEVGRELHERLRVVAEHFQKVGSGLGTAVGAYNAAVQSLESRLLVTARKLETLGAGTKSALPELGTVDEAPRGLRDGDLVR